MTIAAIAQYMVTVGVMFLMLGVGLGIDYRQVLQEARRFKPISRGLLANFIVVPVLVSLSLIWLPLDTGVKLGIILMAAAPLAPMAPPFVAMAKGDVPYSVGLMVIVACLSILLTPLILKLALPAEVASEVALDPMQIVKALVTAQLLPIGIGMAIKERSRKWSEQLLKFVPLLGRIGLIGGVGAILVLQAQQILTMGALAHVVILLWVVACLVIGHVMLLGDTDKRRRALAVSTTIRNIPLVFIVANASFPGTVVAPAALVFGTWSMIVAVAYGKVLDARQGRSLDG